MIEEYIEKALLIAEEFNGPPSPPLLMRRLKVNMDLAQKICHRVRLRMHKEARALAAQLEYDWPPQMDKVRMKNLEKFKKSKKN